MAKKIEEVCGNCKLFDPQRGVCRIVVLHEGMRLNVPVDPKEKCFFDETYFDPKEKQNVSIIDFVQQARFWVEDKNGQKTDKNGIVKIEYPEGFFGDRKITDII